MLLCGNPYAVALFNRGGQSGKVTARWSDVGVAGKYQVRDLWAHQARGAADGEYAAEVASHAVVMVRLSK